MAALGIERNHLMRAQSENQTRPSCQRGDSPNEIPSINTVMRDRLPGKAKTHRSLPGRIRPRPCELVLRHGRRIGRSLRRRCGVTPPG
jgi:hypothetical protein